MTIDFFSEPHVGRLGNPTSVVSLVSSRFAGPSAFGTRGMQGLLLGDPHLPLGFHPCPNEHLYYLLGTLTSANVSHTCSHTEAWMMNRYRSVGDTLLIKCLNKKLRYALSTALSPRPCTDTQRAPSLHTAAICTRTCAPRLRSASLPSSWRRPAGHREEE